MFWAALWLAVEIWATYWESQSKCSSKQLLIKIRSCFDKHKLGLSELLWVSHDLYFFFTCNYVFRYFFVPLGIQRLFRQLPVLFLFHDRMATLSWIWTITVNLVKDLLKFDKSFLIYFCQIVIKNSACIKKFASRFNTVNHND